MKRLRWNNSRTALWLSTLAMLLAADGARADWTWDATDGDPGFTIGGDIPPCDAYYDAGVPAYVMDYPSPGGGDNMIAAWRSVGSYEGDFTVTASFEAVSAAYDLAFYLAEPGFDFPLVWGNTVNWVGARLHQGFHVTLHGMSRSDAGPIMMGETFSTEPQSGGSYQVEFGRLGATFFADFYELVNGSPVLIAHQEWTAAAPTAALSELYIVGWADHNFGNGLSHFTHLSVVGEDTSGCGTLLVRTDKHVVGSGDHPGSTKEGIEGMDVCVFDKSAGSCAAGFGVSWQNYPAIFATCGIVECGTTGVDGSVSLVVPAGDYIVIGKYDPDGFPPNDDGDELYIGRSASDFTCAEDGNPDTITMQKYLQVIEKANGKKVPAKYTKLTGSELLIIEPEYVLWDETDQVYPFVFETIGDWSVTASVVPPDGFVSDYDSLSAEVDNELVAVQFTITEVGSDLVPTETTFDVLHNGERRFVHSNVGILLTPEYAASRGFDVDELRAQGLIKEKRDKPAQSNRR